ncbi:MAG TPA: DUF1697 domain-containing protein [Streptosporangiaceae bacterium]|nr:DUF1697 domain-containing protein [Streptosporangiaceae bacterium]
MPTHVALLRGINVGGGGKLPMADLRTLVSSLGHRDVKTYIQSGNVLFTPAGSHPAGAGSSALAAELQAAITEKFGLRTSAVVISCAELAGVISANPYPGEPEPRYVHGIFLAAEPGEAGVDWVREQVAAAQNQGSRDEATFAGRVLYVHTPDGFGTSELAKALLTKRASPAAAGTARNWNTITKLLALCAE